MKKDKLMYNPPVVDPLVIRFEGWVCQSGGVMNSNGIEQAYDRDDEDEYVFE